MIFDWLGGVGMSQRIGLAAFADADFASDNDTSRSTNGGILFMTGPDTRFPLTFVSQKQKAVSHSTPEARIVAMDHVLRTMLLPSLT
eukprot:2872285-Alexandrium_andersonii.AAC.1